MSDVAVIILNYCTWEATLEEIKMINMICKVNYQDIIVVDNASPNNSAELLEVNNSFGFKLIKSADNKGYASGNNIGLKYAYDNGYEYAWVLNNDVIVNDPDTLIKMKKVFERDSDIAIVNPDICRPDGSIYNRDAVRPSLIDFTIGIFAYKKKGRRIEDLGDYGYVYRPQGCCMLVDLLKMRQVDYMDEFTFLYCEEMILAERLLKKNYRCATCLNAKVVHNHSKTVSTALKKRNICKINNESFEYYLKEYRRYNSISIKFCLLINYIKWWMIA